MKKKKVDYVDIANTLAFIVMVILVLLQIFVRFVLHISVPWTEEFARYFLILITFTGGALAVRDRQHLSIFTLFNMVPKKIRYYLNICFDIAIIVFLIALLKGNIIMIQLSWESPTGSTSWMTLGMLYLLVAVSIVIMFIYLIRQLIKDLKKNTHTYK